MALTLAVIEATLLVVVGCGMILFWSHTVLSNWRDAAIWLMKGVVLSGCCVMSFYYNQLYDLRAVHRFADFAPRLTQAFGVAFILLAGFYTVFPKANIAGGPFVSSLLVIVGLLLPLRALSYVIVRAQPFAERVLIIGTGLLARKLVEEIEPRPYMRYSIVGFADDVSDPDDGSLRYPVFGPLRHLGKIVEEVRLDRIIVALAERRGRLPVNPLLDARLGGVLVEDGVEVYERLAGKLAIESLTPSSIIFSTDFKKSRLDVTISRVISFVAALVGLAVLAPVMFLVAVAIKLDSRGPVFFVQDRVGLYGRCFRLFKFRTMHPVGEERSRWARDNADRITRVGAWIRRFRLDELPQFINILKGDMNLVGPRPHPVANFQMFVENIPYYSLRAVIRPGVTGWAQIHYGYANNLEEETEKMRYDLFYIKHLSLWIDLRILFDTVKIVLFGREGR